MIPNQKYWAPLNKSTVQGKIDELNKEIKNRTIIQKVIVEANRTLHKLSETFILLGCLTGVIGLATLNIAAISLGALGLIVGKGCAKIKVRALKVEKALTHLKQAKKEKGYKAAKHYLKAEETLDENSLEQLDVLLNRTCRLFRKGWKGEDVAQKLKQTAAAIVRISKINNEKFAAQLINCTDTEKGRRILHAMGQMQLIKKFGMGLEIAPYALVRALGPRKKTETNITQLFRRLSVEHLI